METGGVYAGFEQKRCEFEKLRNHIWGVALKQNKDRTKQKIFSELPISGKPIGRIKKKHNDESTVHVTFRIHFEDTEKFIYHRLEREKRWGTVTLLDENNAQFDVDVFDPQEVIPWARSFICRITYFDCSEKIIARRFYDDIRKMNRLYSENEN